ncbi:hypothetical protein GQ457_03G023620 [Hibiscus cannabinus]
MMNSLSWNVRGIGRLKTCRALSNLMFKYKPNIVFLSETKQKKPRLKRLRDRFRFANYFYFEPEGIGGCLALCWTNNVHITILLAGRNIIDISIRDREDKSRFFSFVSGPPKKE